MTNTCLFILWSYERHVSITISTLCAYIAHHHHHRGPAITSGNPRPWHKRFRMSAHFLNRLWMMPRPLYVLPHFNIAFARCTSKYLSQFSHFKERKSSHFLCNRSPLHLPRHKTTKQGLFLPSSWRYFPLLHTWTSIWRQQRRPRRHSAATQYTATATDRQESLLAPESDDSCTWHPCAYTQEHLCSCRHEHNARTKSGKRYDRYTSVDCLFCTSKYTFYKTKHRLWLLVRQPDRTMICLVSSSAAVLTTVLLMSNS